MAHGAITSRSTASYDKSGQVTAETYPSNHTVNYSYDGAGRLQSFTGKLGDGSQRTYSTGVSYSPFGGMTEEQFGTTNTPIYNKRHYNVRGQLYDVRASTLSLAQERVGLGPRRCGFILRRGWLGASRHVEQRQCDHATALCSGAETGYSANYWYAPDSYGYDALKSTDFSD
jgi:YD repeat-containing protein